MLVQLQRAPKREMQRDWMCQAAQRRQLCRTIIFVWVYADPRQPLHIKNWLTKIKGVEEVLGCAIGIYDKNISRAQRTILNEKSY